MAFVPQLASLPLRPAPSRRHLCSTAAPRMAAGTHVGPDTKAEDYLAYGIAKVFRRQEANLEELLVIEPVPASAMDCVARLKVPTSYLRLWGTTLGDVPETISDLPPGVVMEGESVVFGESFTERSQASARTYRRSPEIAKMLPKGQITADINHSVERKRLIEDDWEPDFSDNVKQDKSIDVYNRDDDASDVKELYNL